MCLFHGALSAVSYRLADLVGLSCRNGHLGASDRAHRGIANEGRPGRSVFYLRDWPRHRLPRSDTATYRLLVSRGDDWLLRYRADRPCSGNERKGARRAMTRNFADKPSRPPSFGSTTPQIVVHEPLV